MDFFKIDSKNVIVIYDDVDIDVGKLRIKKNGSSGLHNGIKSIIECIGTTEFIRIRVGIGKARFDMVSHVLGKFEEEEKEIIKEITKTAAMAAKYIVDENEEKAMNKYN